MHQARVGRDAVQPCPKLRLASKRRQVSVHLQERILEDVRRVGLARETAGEPKHPRLVPFRNRLEGMVVPGRCARRERLVARFGRGDDHGH